MCGINGILRLSPDASPVDRKRVRLHERNPASAGGQLVGREAHAVVTFPRMSGRMRRDGTVPGVPHILDVLDVLDVGNDSLLPLLLCASEGFVDLHACAPTAAVSQLGSPFTYT